MMLRLPRLLRGRGRSEAAPSATASTIIATDSALAEERRRKVDDVWSVPPEAKAEAQGWYWMQHGMVVARINQRISGNQHLDAYARLGEYLNENGLSNPLGACVSLGCGFGRLERDLLRRGLVKEIDAYDLS